MTSAIPLPLEKAHRLRVIVCLIYEAKVRSVWVMALFVNPLYLDMQSKTFPLLLHDVRLDGRHTARRRVSFQNLAQRHGEAVRSIRRRKDKELDENSRSR
jgi:hypothetical protein